MKLSESGSGRVGSRRSRWREVKVKVQLIRLQASAVQTGKLLKLKL